MVWAWFSNSWPLIMVTMENRHWYPYNWDPRSTGDWPPVFFKMQEDPLKFVCEVLSIIIYNYWILFRDTMTYPTVHRSHYTWYIVIHYRQHRVFKFSTAKAGCIGGSCCSLGAPKNDAFQSGLGAADRHLCGMACNQHNQHYSEQLVGVTDVFLKTDIISSLQVKWRFLLLSRVPLASGCFHLFVFHYFPVKMKVKYPSFSWSGSRPGDARGLSLPCRSLRPLWSTMQTRTQGPGPSGLRRHLFDGACGRTVKK